MAEQRTPEQIAKHMTGWRRDLAALIRRPEATKEQLVETIDYLLDRMGDWVNDIRSLPQLGVEGPEPVVEYEIMTNQAFVVEYETKFPMIPVHRQVEQIAGLRDGSDEMSLAPGVLECENKPWLIVCYACELVLEGVYLEQQALGTIRDHHEEKHFGIQPRVRLEH